MIGRVPIGFALAAAALAATACSPGSPPANDQRPGPEKAAAATAPAAPAEAAPPPSPLRSAAAKGQRRCGWLVNPTPANWWLTDRDGQWILATQGADQAPGMDETPDMSAAGWVETNGHYGYGCACMTIAADSDGRVTRVSDAQPRPLEQCELDRRLPKPE